MDCVATKPLTTFFARNHCRGIVRVPWALPDRLGMPEGDYREQLVRLTGTYCAPPAMHDNEGL